VMPAHPDGIDPEEATARHLAAMAMVEAIRRRANDVLYGPIASDLLAEHEDRAAHLERVQRGGGAASAERAARGAILAQQAKGELSGELLSKLAQDLDFEENRMRNALG